MFDSVWCTSGLGVCSIWQELTPHALYMRLRRLLGRTDAGKLQVPEELHQQWLHGNRDELELAMVKSLKLHGFATDAQTRKLVRVGPRAHP